MQGAMELNKVEFVSLSYNTYLKKYDKLRSYPWLSGLPYVSAQNPKVPLDRHKIDTGVSSHQPRSLLGQFSHSTSGQVEKGTRAAMSRVGVRTPGRGLSGSHSGMLGRRTGSRPGRWQSITV